MIEKTPKIAKTELCGICGDGRLFAPQGLRWHKQLKHGAQPNNPPTNKELPQSAKSIEKEKILMDDNCKDCEVKGKEIDGLTTQLTQLNTQLAEATSKASEAERLKEQLATRDLPNLEDFIAHCTDGSCEGHAQQLKDYREKVAGDVLTNLSKPENKDQLLNVMEAHGIEPAPTKIVLRG